MHGKRCFPREALVLIFVACGATNIKEIAICDIGSELPSMFTLI